MIDLDVDLFGFAQGQMATHESQNTFHASAPTVCLRQENSAQKLCFYKLAHHFRNSGIHIVVG